MKIYLPRILFLVVSALIQYLILLYAIASNNISIYGSNDDALIAWFSTDSLLGVDRNNWVFLQSLISIPAVWLQSQVSSIGLYGHLLAFVIILSISGLFSLIPVIKGNYARFLFLILFSTTAILFFPFAILNPTYTGAALFSGSVGFGILTFILRSKIIQTPDLLILSGFLISLSYLIRVESFLLTFGFFLILIIIDFLIFRPKTLSLNLLKIPISIFIIIFSTNFFLEKSNYSSDAWQEYIEVNDLRHSIQLRTAEYVLGDHLEEVGWSQYDYELFRKFSLADPDKLNVNSLEKAVAVTSYTRGIDAILSSNFKNEIIFINYSYSTQHWMLMIILVMILFIFLLYSFRNFRYLFYVFTIFGFIFSINYIFATSYHLPDRLTFNLLFMLTVALLVYGISNERDLKSVNKNYLLPVCVSSMAFTLVLMIQILPQKISERIEFNVTRIELYEKQKLSNVSKEQILVGNGSRLIYQGQNPYKKFENINSNENFIYLGWHNLSPIWSKQVSQKGLDPNKFHQEFLNNKNLYWIDDEGAIEGLQGFYQQYSRDSVSIEDQGSLGSDFYRIFKISQVN